MLDPFRHLSFLRDEIDRLFDAPVSALTEGTQPFLSGWLPAVDLYQDRDNITVKAELPGMKKEDVHVTMEENDLVLFGERKEETETNKDNYYRAECSYGSFYRRLPLAFQVNPENITAKFTDGVLEVHVPMPPEERNQALPIPVQ